jgi:hypothetical protein
MKIIIAIAAVGLGLWLYSGWEHQRYENALIVVYPDDNGGTAYEFTPDYPGSIPETGDPDEIRKEGGRIMYRWQFDGSKKSTTHD